MAHVTRISAGKSSKKDPVASPAKSPKAKATKTKAPAPKTNKAAKPEVKTAAKTGQKPKKLSIITAPFRALGRYFSASWQEIRQVRWPSRKATWKLVLAVFIYTAIFMVFIMLLDALFTFIFNNILG